MCNKYSCTKCNCLNMDGTNFPIPISEIPKVGKQNDLAINDYVFTVWKKIVEVSVFPYHISNQAIDMLRINLLLMSVDAESNSTETNNTKHYCWTKGLNRLLYDQNKHKCKTPLLWSVSVCLHQKDLLIKHKEDCLGIN